MNQLQIFKNPQFGQVRVIEKDGEGWLVGKDIADALGYVEPHKAIDRHVDEEDRMKHPILSNGGMQDSWIINESGLYSLVLSSKLPTAKKFKKWVTKEVLPSIRKHGMYAKDELLDNPDLLLEVITRLKEEREQNKLLQTENKLLTQKTLTWADRKIIEALVKKYGAKIGYQEAWREFKKELLYAHGINLNLRITNWRNEHSRKTGPKTLDMIHDEEIEACISTAVALCKNNEIAINDVIQKFSKEAV
jgi:anti-repressor protein